MKNLLRYFGVIVCLCVMSFSAYSQISVKSFEYLETDLEANTYNPKKDLNGKTCAIIKIFTTQKDFSFENGALGIIATEYKSAEIWLYVQEGTRKLKITHPALGHITNGESDGYYWFPEQLRSGCVYKMELVTGEVRILVEEAKKQTGWLVFNSVPEGADIYVIEENGEESYFGTTPVSKKMVYGSYNFKVKKYKFHDDVGVAVVDKTRVVMDLKLTPAFGAVQVTSQPQGARVIINGDDTGKVTPCMIDEVASGKCEVRLLLKDYAPGSDIITVTDGVIANVNVSLEPNFATVTINSLPNAEIKINGAVSGTGSLTTNLQEGIYDIEVSLASHRVASKQIEVVKGVSQTLELTPEPIYGSLDVNSEPMGAVVTINGVNYGDTPNTIEKILVGDYDVVFSKSGYASVVRKVTLKEDMPVSITATLPQGKLVSISTGMSGDEIYIDGTLVGTSPYNAQVSFGTHEVVAKRGDKSVSQTVTVAQGGESMAVQLSFGLLSPRWSSTVTSSQRVVLERLISNMVKVEGGTFTMGATSEQLGDASGDESPAHEVKLSDYFIGKYEVTQEEWQAVMGKNPSKFKSSPSNPVESVSWKDCQKFIEKLNGLTGLNFRLPTEAEWEYAARGGNKSQDYKYSGSNWLDEVAWYNGNSDKKTHIVGTTKPNELGLYDMSGNVWEWCNDWYDKNYYSKSPQQNPTGPTGPSYRVLRGGGWLNSARSCRVSNRDFNNPSNRSYNDGFRLVSVSR